ncbi:MAG: TRAP transporter small permease [Deltaproteobacteria bacterium]|nr:TRAP transporter small permease [Deltaproteobacteria bacterium]
MAAFKKIDNFIHQTEKYFVGIGTLVITLMAFIGVITRFFLNFTFSWMEEALQYLMLWIAATAAALIVRTQEHVSVDIINFIVPQKHHKRMRAVLNIASGIFMCYFVYITYTLVLNVFQNNQISVSMTWLPMYTVYLGALIAFVLMTFEFFKYGIQSWASEKQQNGKAGNIG